MALNGLLADVHCGGHLTHLLRLMEREERRELWEGLELKRMEFAEVGLPLEAADREVWEKCQSDELILITANRNDDGPDSLEATLRDAGQDVLPVITIADAERLLVDSLYAEAAADRLLEYLYDIELHRGASRSFIP